MSPTTKKIFAVAAVCALAALSARAESPAEKGIHLSEWGTETALPEYESPAPAALKAENDDAPDFGEFLAEEWNTFGAGALDPERLRKMMANRAVGREDDSLMSFMASRWESAPGRLANFLTGYGEARLNALPGVENARLGLTPGGDNGFGFSASGVGMLHRSANSGFGLQPTVEKSATDGNFFGSFGAFQRWALGNWAVAGLNIFADYADSPDKGAASRYRVGADFSSAWVDADIRRFIGGEGERRRTADGRLFQAYAPHGTAAELRVHSPNLLWLEGFAKFSELEGRGGKADQRAHAFGMTYQPRIGPLTGLRADAQFADDGDAKLDLAYSWVIGQGARAPKTADPFNVYTNIAEAVADGTFDPENYEIYEALHLYELQENIGTVGITLSAAQLSMAIVSMWSKVPEYLQIAEEHQGSCPPPVFAVDRDYSAVANQHLDEARAWSRHMYEVNWYTVLEMLISLGYTDEQSQQAEYEKWIEETAIWGAHATAIQTMASCELVLGGASSINLIGYYTTYRNQLKYAMQEAVDKIAGYHRHVRSTVVSRNDLDPLRLHILAGYNLNDKTNFDSYVDDETVLDHVQGHLGQIWNRRGDENGIPTWGMLPGMPGTWLGDWKPEWGLQPIGGYYNRDPSEAEKRAKIKLMDDLVKMLIVNGAECNIQSGPICDFRPGDFPDLQPVVSLALRARPPEGRLSEVSTKYVASGFSGIMFTITAGTDYVDVEYDLPDPGNVLDGLLTIANNGGFTDHAGTLNAGRLRINTPTKIGRRNTVYRSKEGVLTALRPLQASMTYTVTVQAKFFYHIHARNTVEQIFEMIVVDQNPRRLVVTEDDGTARLNYRFPGLLANLSVENIGNDDRLTYSAGGFALSGPLDVGQTVAVNFKATASNLAGDITLNYKVANPALDDPIWLDAKFPDCRPTKPHALKDKKKSRMKRSIESGELEDLCEAIRKNANINQASSPKLLHTAISVGNRGAQRILLVNGADADASDGNDGAPIHMAAKVGDVVMGRFLLNANSDRVNVRSSDSNKTPLHVLANVPSSDDINARGFAQLLTNYNVNVSAKADDKWAYLHYVASSGNPDSMDTILPKRPEPHVATENNNGRLPLHMAVEDNNVSVVHKMLENADTLGLDVNHLEPVHKKAAIHYAKSREVLTLLLCAGSSFDLRVGDDAPTNAGDTAYEIISRRNGELGGMRNEWRNYERFGFLSRVCGADASGVLEGRPDTLNPEGVASAD